MSLSMQCNRDALVGHVGPEVAAEPGTGVAEKPAPATARPMVGGSQSPSLKLNQHRWVHPTCPLVVLALSTLDAGQHHGCPFRAFMASNRGQSLRVLEFWGLSLGV